MVSFYTSLLDIILPDGTELPGRRFEEDDGRYVLPVGDDAEWPDRVVGHDGLVVRVVGRPKETVPVRARWATGDDTLPRIVFPHGEERTVILEKAG